MLLVAAFVVVPIVEIYVLIQVGQVIGVGWTVLLLVLDSILGGWLIRREGARAWRAMRTTLEAGRMPARELADGGLVVLGGTLMLSPGFVTDVFGILLILPITRPLFRGVLTTLVSRRLVGGVAGGGPAGPGGFPGAPRPDARRPGPGPQGPVVRGEVVDDE
ncbi:exlusion protein FxsA [Nocardioides sp. Leaf285]|nr:exlusion protein FxsA [Nocardioides sp. Leaf285]